MMDHAQYRQAMDADPHNPDAELRAHRDVCQECNLYTERLLRFELRLERALRVNVAAGADLTVHADLPVTAGLPAGARRERPWRWMALAASVLLGAVAAAGIWLVLPGRSLAADVVAHMAEEPGAWRRTDVSVPAPELNAVLRESNIRLAASAGPVSYANSCFFRGHDVPHLVVQTESGPVTVMVLVHESVSRPTQFDELGFRGTIVPIPGHGSIAVLMRGPSVDAAELAQIVARVRDGITWMP
jgi:Protein of unknown function (DUF3379)